MEKLGVYWEGGFEIRWQIEVFICDKQNEFISSKLYTINWVNERETREFTKVTLEDKVEPSYGTVYLGSYYIYIVYETLYM